MRERDPLAFYRPHQKQVSFHRSLAAYRAVMGGNRSGKTEMGVVEDLWIATGTHPYVKPPIPNRGRIGVTDFKVMEQVTWPKIEKWLPKRMIKDVIKGYKGAVTGVRLFNDSFFDIMSYEQPPMKWESVDLDWIHFDEPPPYETFKASRARLIDRDGRMWFTLTPLEEPWLFDEIWEKCKEGTRYWGIDVDMRDNPYLSRTAIGHYISEVSSDDYEARVLGKFRHLTGRVLKDFTDQYPYVMPKGQIVIQKSWPRLMILDPHEKTPWCTQWYAWDEQNDTIFRIDELRFDPAKSIDEYGEAVRNIERYHNADVPPHGRIVDTYAAKPLYNSGGSSLIDELRSIAGLDFRVADKTDQGKRLWDLIYRYKINPATRLPRMVTLEHCAAARKEIVQYVWDKHRTKAGQWSEDKQHPVKKNDHALSCDMYMTAEWPSIYRNADPINIFKSYEPASDDFVFEEGLPINFEDAVRLVNTAGRRSRARRASGFMERG